MITAIPSHSENPPVGDSERNEGGSVVETRFQRLIDTEIQFVPNPHFETQRGPMDEEIRSMSSSAGYERDDDRPRDLPGHLARLCEAKVLDAETEAQLFRLMNFQKHWAHHLRQQIEPDAPQEALVNECEDYLAGAMAMRDTLVKSNMRLVMSVVKRFVSPQHSYDDMLSDGVHSLMLAVEKFDYDRGFRFSTYAYRAITRNLVRAISNQRKEGARFATDSQEAAERTMDHRDSSSRQEQALEKLHGSLSDLIQRLDRREQFVIRCRYALGPHRKVRTCQNIADKLGISKERVRQIEHRAVEKLRRWAKKSNQDDLVENVFN